MFQLPLSSSIPPWLTMWALALGLYAILKVCSWQLAGGTHRFGWLDVAYLVAWPGMNAVEFLNNDQRKFPRPTAAQWIFAALKLSAGVVLLLLAADHSFDWNPVLCGGMGMIGIAFLLHFGLFHVLSLTWRYVGLTAAPIMNWPIAATNLADFWGNRWNRAFRDLSHRFLFRPLVPYFGSSIALLISFVISGLIHELVISIPAQAGYGGPTLYFTIQGMGVLSEHRMAARLSTASRSFRERLFCAAIVLLPLPLLFHLPFVCNVIVPFLQAVRSMP